MSLLFKLAVAVGLASAVLVMLEKQLPAPKGTITQFWSLEQGFANLEESCCK